MPALLALAEDAVASLRTRGEHRLPAGHGAGIGHHQQLVGASLVAVGPTAWTGWAEWDQAAPRDKRVGLVHAVTNGLAIGLYAASYLSRKRGRHETGARLGLAGATVASVGGYIGGHLAIARKVGTAHPAVDG